MAREKTTGVYFKMSPEENEWFERRMAETGITNKSAFIRKMCIDGHVYKLDLSTLNEIGRLLRITSNNVNQIARRANSGGNIYPAEVSELVSLLTDIRTDFGKLLSILSEMAEAIPGKSKFVPPLTIRDLPEYTEAHKENKGA